MTARVKGEVKHGTVTGYQSDSCRCSLCRAAWAEYSRRWRRGARIRTTDMLGTITAKELGHKLGVSAATIGYYANQGMPRVRVNGWKWARYQEQECVAWFAGRPERRTPTLTNHSADSASTRYAIRVRKWLSEVLIDRRAMTRLQLEHEPFAMRELPGLFAQMSGQQVLKHGVAMIVEASQSEHDVSHLALALVAFKKRVAVQSRASEVCSA